MIYGVWVYFPISEYSDIPLYWTTRQFPRFPGFNYMEIKNPQSKRIKGFLRSRADSNRCTRFCRPLPSRSATRPERIAKLAKYLLFQTFFKDSSIIIATFSTSPLIGGQILMIFTLTACRLCNSAFNL